MHVPAGALMVLITQTRTGVNMLLFPSRFDKSGSVVDKELYNKSQMQVRERSARRATYAPAAVRAKAHTQAHASEQVTPWSYGTAPGLKGEPLARETAPKTDVTILSCLGPMNASSAPWSSTPSLTALLSAWQCCSTSWRVHGGGERD